METIEKLSRKASHDSWWGFKGSIVEAKKNF